MRDEKSKESIRLPLFSRSVYSPLISVSYT